MGYARGKRAYGFCDLTGFRYPLSRLKRTYVDGRWTGLLVGDDVWEPDQPQNHLGQVRVDDAQALRNPRPDTTLVQERALAAWNPVGGGVTAFGSRTVGLDASGHVGRVRVEIG